MITTVFALAFFTIGVGAVALRSNVHRWTHQVFALSAVLVAGWLWCIGEAMLIGPRFASDPSANPLFWIRANGAITCLLPWITVLLAEAVCCGDRRRKAILRSLPMLTVSLVAAFLCFTEWFIPADSTPAHPVRGHGYWACTLLAFVQFIVVIGHSATRMRQQSGFRRFEMLFLPLNLSVCLPFVVAMMALGNLLHLAVLKQVGLLAVPAAFLLSGWALTLERLYDARQILLSLVQRVALVAFLAIGVWYGTHLLEGFTPAPANLIISVIVCSFAALALDGKSRDWLDLSGHRRFGQLKAAVIELSRIEPHTGQLVIEFEQVIQRHYGATFAAVLVERGAEFANPRLTIDRSHDAFPWIIEHGWATPERIERADPSTGASALRQLMLDRRIGILVAAPAGSVALSLLVALGTRQSKWPFTYPEVLQIQEIAGTIDNILARSQMITEQGMKAKLDHLAMMSRGLAHDLKNLLTPISSFLVHTTGRYPAGSAEDEVHTAARRSVAIINDYISEALFFARKLTPNFQPTDLGKVGAAVEDIVLARAERRGVSVTIRLSDVGPITADGVLVQRLLVNLVHNAIDASPVGADVEVSATASRSHVRIEVADEGSGISKENAAWIFEPYFTTKKYGHETRGFGLGLTICEKIVALHHGKVTVQSQVGIGTTVVIELPVEQRPTTSATTTSGDRKRPSLSADTAQPAS